MWNLQSNNPIVATEDKSTLTAYFNLNRTNEAAREVLYRNLPIDYVYKRQTNEWVPRQKDPAVGRIQPASPSNKELFFLRLLLLVSTGATSFDDLKTGSLNKSMFIKILIQLPFINCSRWPSLPDIPRSSSGTRSCWKWPRIWALHGRNRNRRLCKNAPTPFCRSYCEHTLTLWAHTFRATQKGSLIIFLRIYN